MKPRRDRSDPAAAWRPPQPRDDLGEAERELAGEIARLVVAHGRPHFRLPGELRALLAPVQGGLDALAYDRRAAVLTAGMAAADEQMGVR